MNYSEFKKAAFASRIAILLAITLMFIFSALVILENTELRKILPDTSLRSFTILCGYSVAILSSNYFLALRGRNLTNWRTELLISLNYILFFAGWILPSLFPVQREASPPWYMPWRKVVTVEQNILFYGVLILLVPLTYFTVQCVRKYFDPNRAA